MRRVRAPRPAAPPDLGRDRRGMKPRPSLRVGAPLRPVIGRRGRIGRRIRGRAPLSLFWRRRKPARGSGPPQPSHMASWSLSLSLLQKIVLGLREPSRREAGAKAPPVPTASAVAAWGRSGGAEAPRKLTLPARQLWVLSAKPASAPAASRLLPMTPLAAAATPTLRRRAAPVPVAAVSPNGSPIGRLIGTPRTFGRPSAGSSVDRRNVRERWRRSGSARHRIGAASAGPAGSPGSASERVAAACIGAAPAGPAGRRRAHRRVAGASHGGPVDRSPSSTGAARLWSAMLRRLAAAGRPSSSGRRRHARESRPACRRLPWRRSPPSRARRRPPSRRESRRRSRRRHRCFPTSTDWSTR